VSDWLTGQAACFLKSSAHIIEQGYQLMWRNCRPTPDRRHCVLSQLTFRLYEFDGLEFAADLNPLLFCHENKSSVWERNIYRREQRRGLVPSAPSCALRSSKTLVPPMLPCTLNNGGNYVFHLKRNSVYKSICRVWWHQCNKAKQLFFSVSSTLRGVSPVNTARRPSRIVVLPCRDAHCCILPANINSTFRYEFVF
jgi:hypothetical protein